MGNLINQRTGCIYPPDTGRLKASTSGERQGVGEGEGVREGCGVDDEADPTVMP